ncbi:PEP-CTERM sorting domain-containing protein [Nitrosococcus watsonii]|nr:PEP-CTERM sorting domain-containing protein [Nitrosococcus watsonii]
MGKLLRIFLLLASSMGNVQALIIELGGDALLGVQPANLRNHHYESNVNVFAFNEQAFVLTEDLSVNREFEFDGDLNNAIAAGTHINSHLLHFDPIGKDKKGKWSRAKGWITFDTDIIGLIYSNRFLRGSDFLSQPGTLFSKSGRKLDKHELNHGGWNISADSRTLWFDWKAKPAVDQLRVITDPPVNVSAPSSLALLLLGGGIFAVGRGRKLLA